MRLLHVLPLVIAQNIAQGQRFFYPQPCAVNMRDRAPEKTVALQQNHNSQSTSPRDNPMPQKDILFRRYRCRCFAALMRNPVFDFIAEVTDQTLYRPCSGIT